MRKHKRTIDLNWGGNSEAQIEVYPDHDLINVTLFQDSVSKQAFKHTDVICLAEDDINLIVQTIAECKAEAIPQGAIS